MQQAVLIAEPDQLQLVKQGMQLLVGLTCTCAGVGGFPSLFDAWIHYMSRRVEGRC